MYPTVLPRNYEARVQPDVTIIAYGGISGVLSPLLEELAKEEIYVLACLPGCLSPLVSDPIVEAASTSGRVIVIEEGPTEYGWGRGGNTHFFLPS